MHTTEHTDLDGDALTIHRDKGLAWVTLTRDEKELTVGPIREDILAPLGSYVRHEKHYDGLTLSPVQQQRDQAIARAVKAEKERDEWKTRAEAAEPSRDVWRRYAKERAKVLKEQQAVIESLRATVRLLEGGAA